MNTTAHDMISRDPACAPPLSHPQAHLPYLSSCFPCPAPLFSQSIRSHHHIQASIVNYQPENCKLSRARLVFSKILVRGVGGGSILFVLEDLLLASLGPFQVCRVNSRHSKIDQLLLYLSQDRVKLLLDGRSCFQRLLERHAAEDGVLQTRHVHVAVDKVIHVAVNQGTHIAFYQVVHCVIQYKCCVVNILCSGLQMLCRSVLVSGPAAHSCTRFPVLALASAPPCRVDTMPRSPCVEVQVYARMYVCIYIYIYIYTHNTYTYNLCRTLMM